jgi:serine/threonine-protein kinase RsbW
MSILSTTQNLGAVRRFVAEHAEQTGFSQDVIEQIRLAVDEACSNVIRHAYADNEEGPVNIEVEIDPKRFVISIQDEGTTFDPKQYDMPNLEQSIQARRGGGFGILIMRELMDQVEYHSDGTKNEVRLTKLRPQPSPPSKRNRNSSKKRTSSPKTPPPPHASGKNASSSE